MPTMHELMMSAYGQYLPIVGEVPCGTYQKYEGKINIRHEIGGNADFMVLMSPGTGIKSFGANSQRTDHIIGSTNQDRLAYGQGLFNKDRPQVCSFSVKLHSKYKRNKGCPCSISNLEEQNQIPKHWRRGHTTVSTTGTIKWPGIQQRQT